MRIIHKSRCGDGDGILHGGYTGQQGVAGNRPEKSLGARVEPFGDARTDRGRHEGIRGRGRPRKERAVGDIGLYKVLI